MVQELHVLKCFSCETFQTQIVKKTNKWECKICGEKQSVKKVYGRGSGKDCRLHTQKLNALKGEKEDSKLIVKSDEEINDGTPKQDSRSFKTDLDTLKTSKWSAYVDEDQLEAREGSFSIPRGIIPISQSKTKDPKRYSKRKRKHEMAETDVEEHSINSKNYDELENDIKTYYPLDSKTIKNKNKKLKPYNEFGNIHKSFDECFISEVVEEDENMTFSNSAVKNPIKQIGGAKPSFKWSKYLEDESNEGENHPYDSQSLIKSPILCNENSAIENVLKSVKKTSFVINKFNSNTNNCSYKNLINGSNSTDHVSSRSEKSQSSTTTLSDTTSTVHFNESGKGQNEVSLKADESHVPISVSIFEQDCDLSDSDFQLDF